VEWGCQGGLLAEEGDSAGRKVRGVGVVVEERGMIILRKGGVDWEGGIVGTSVCWVGMLKGCGEEGGGGVRTVEG
jgi:hypothetical protein